MEEIVRFIETSTNAKVVSATADQVVYQVGKYDRYYIRRDPAKDGYRYGKIVNGKKDGDGLYCPNWRPPLRFAGVQEADTGYRIELEPGYQKLVVAWKRR